MKHEFTKRRFLALRIEQQHKKCAEILRLVYQAHLQKRYVADVLAGYQELSLWLELTPIEHFTAKAIADRYHLHLNLAHMQHKEHNLLPAIRSGDKTIAAPTWPIAIYFDNIRSAHNVGSMLRTVEAFGLGNVFFSESTPFMDHKQVQDAAMGATQWLSCYRNASLESLPKPIVALETASSAIPLHEFIFPEVFTLVVGNEEYGCSDSTLAQANFLIEIPLRGHKNSLNVANAFAIAAAEIAKQKNSSYSQPSL